MIVTLTDTVIVSVQARGLTITGDHKLLIRCNGALLVYALSTDLRLDGSVLKVRNVGLGWKRIVRWSSEIVDVKVGVCLNWALNLVVAGIVGFLASCVSAETNTSIERGKTVFVIPIEVQSSLRAIDEGAVGIIQGIVNVSPVLKGPIKLQSTESRQRRETSTTWVYAPSHC